MADLGSREVIDESKFVQFGTRNYNWTLPICIFFCDGMTGSVRKVHGNMRNC